MLSDKVALPVPANGLMRALQPLIDQPDDVLLWSPPLVVNGRFD
jgi:hypothetical protein